MLGEMLCLNCSRYLADVVDGGAGRLRLRAPAGLATRPILVVTTPSGLRCARCGGRPMLEPVPPGEAHPRPASAVNQAPAAA
jgi:hypothetical protein